MLLFVKYGHRLNCVYMESLFIFKYKPMAVSLEKEKIVPDQEKPELVVRQPLFSYATYISALPRNTLHS